MYNCQQPDNLRSSSVAPSTSVYLWTLIIQTLAASSASARVLPLRAVAILNAPPLTHIREVLPVAAWTAVGPKISRPSILIDP